MWRLVRKLIGFTFAWSLSSILAFLAWAWTIMQLPEYVVWLGRVSESISAILIDILSTVLPVYAAAFASLPAGKGIMYLAFFLPTYLIVKVSMYAMSDTNRYA